MEIHSACFQSPLFPSAGPVRVLPELSKHPVIVDAWASSYTAWVKKGLFCQVDMGENVQSCALIV